MMPLVGVMLGIFSPFAIKKQLKIILAFGGAYILSITMLHLIPEVFSQSKKQTSYWVLLGFFLQVVLDLFSNGVEHGHLHVQKQTRIRPFVLIFALAIHALLEGAAIGGNFFESHILFQLVLGVGIHEIPAAFTLVVLLKTMNWTKFKVGFTGIFYSLLVPIGIVLGHYILPQNPAFVHGLSALLIGTFLHISTTIILENSENHKLSIQKAIAIALALTVAIMSSFI